MNATSTRKSIRRINGARLVTGDDHFDRVEALEALTHGWERRHHKHLLVAEQLSVNVTAKTGEHERDTY